MSNFQNHIFSPNITVAFRKWPITCPNRRSFKKWVAFLKLFLITLWFPCSKYRGDLIPLSFAYTSAVSSEVVCSLMVYSFQTFCLCPCCHLWFRSLCPLFPQSLIQVLYRVRSSLVDFIWLFIFSSPSQYLYMRTSQNSYIRLSFKIIKISKS